MKFCQEHWDRLRQAIKARGLGDFVSASGMEAMAKEVQGLEGMPQTLSRFDPLMGAHWNIVNNAMSMLSRIGINPFVMMTAEDGTPKACPICFLNKIAEDRDKNCFDPECKWVKGTRFDSWIDRAADGVIEYMKTLPAK